MDVQGSATTHATPFPMYDGVDYSPSRRAGKCPRCGAWVKARSVRPFEGRFRTRYHACASCGASFKSLEQDPTL